MTRATYILCIEHPRLMCLSREFELPPQAAMSQALDRGSWLSLTQTQIHLIGCKEDRVAREGARRWNLYCVRGSKALEPQKGA